MSDDSGQSEQEQSPETSTMGERWGDDISDERKAELEARLQAWEKETYQGLRRGPFDSGPFQEGDRLTGSDVFWLAARSLTKSSDETAIRSQKAKLTSGNPFDWPALPKLHLEGAPLNEAYLEGARLEEAHLEGANLDRAHLDKAFLGKVHLERAGLQEAHLEGVDLSEAYLQRANLRRAHLERAGLQEAHLQEAVLLQAHLEKTVLWQAHAERAVLQQAHLEEAAVGEVHLAGADLGEAHLERADLEGAHLVSTKFQEAHLAGINLSKADLSGADLSRADLSGADLSRANLSGADLREANLSGADLSGADLSGADLREAHLAVETALTQATFSPTTLLADVVWNSVPLARVNWKTLPVLGDETQARQLRDRDGKKKEGETRQEEYETAVRAYRLLAVTLRSQGLNEQADRYAFRAQLLQQGVLRRQHKVGGYVFSRLLDGLAGYGYKPVRGLIAYVVVILGFAFAYGLATHGILTFGLARSSIQPLQWYEALVLSISSFHGRGFFQPVQSLGDPVAIIAAAEAIIGLLIEISFIATFTQRFFGR